MESARSNLVRNTIALLVAFALGVMVTNPAGFVGRARYWIPFGDRTGALDRLVEAEPNGATSELSNALESDDADLRLAAAVHLAGRGDKRGVQSLVELCDAKHPGARAQLEGLLLNSGTLDNYETAQEWYDATHHVIHFEPAMRWSGSSVN